MIFTKRHLMNAVLLESKIEDYMGSTAFSANDAEFYTEMASYVWDELEVLIQDLKSLSPEERNSWAFEMDLNADQMRWMEKNLQGMTLHSARGYLNWLYHKRMLNAYGEVNIDRLIYDTIRRQHLDSAEGYRHVAMELLVNSIPKVQQAQV